MLRSSTSGARNGVLGEGPREITEPLPNKPTRDRENPYPYATYIRNIPKEIGRRYYEQIGTNTRYIRYAKVGHTYVLVNILLLFSYILVAISTYIDFFRSFRARKLLG